MHRIAVKRGPLGAALVAALGVTAATTFAGSPASPAVAQTPPAVGIVCTTGTSPTPTFNLTTSSGYISLPDDNAVLMYGFSIGGFAVPAPRQSALCVNEGDTVTVTLENHLAVDTSITFPGQVDVLANGVAATPQFSGLTLTSATNVAAANGGTVTYSFVASDPGHVPVRIRHQPRHPGAHGPVRRPGSCARRWAPTSSTTAPTASSRRTRSSSCCCRRSTRT